jgi:RHS repeat-associated protein
MLDRRVLSGLVAVLLFTLIQLPTSASAQTPHSVTKTCNYSGGASCGSPTATTTAWEYDSCCGPYLGYYSSVSAAAEAQSAWYTNPPNTFCTATPGTTTDEGSIRSEYGIDIEHQYNVAFSYTAYTTTTPVPCSEDTNGVSGFYGNRSVICTEGTLTYTSSPAVGPYCQISTSTSNPPKALGPSCSGGCPTGSTSGSSGAAGPGSGGSSKGDPVDVANGNAFESELDYRGGTANLISFTRYYNSLASLLAYQGKQPPVNTLMGVSWSATYFQFLFAGSITDSTGTHNTVYAFRPDGRQLAFNEYSGAYSPDGDVGDSLIQTSTGWQYQTDDDTIETYNTAGQQTSIARRGQSQVTVSYPAGSALGTGPASVSDAFGHSLQFSYLTDATKVQRLASITDPSGHQITYTYDQYGRLTVVIYADGTTRTYSYANSSNGYLLTTLTDEAGNAFATWTYQGTGTSVLSSQNAGGVNAYSFSTSLSGSGGSVTATDPLGKLRTYNQSLIWGRYRTTTSTAQCPGCGEDASRVYDPNGNITTRTDFNGNVTKYSYNAQTNLETSRTEAYGTSSARTITTAWDPNWRQPDTITEPNRTTSFTYNSLGDVLTKTVTDTTVTPNVSRTWTYTYDSYGRMLTAKGPRTDVNSTYTYAYYTCTTGAQCGQLQTVTDPVGNVTTYNTYNAHGQPLTITDPNGVVTTLTYDNRLRLTSRQVGTDLTSFSYYPTGLLKQVTLPDGSFVLYTYDNAHRLTEISDGIGNSIQYTLDNMGNRTAEKIYDPSNNLHRTHTRAFNTLNELYQDINAAGSSAVTTTYGYDNNANQNSIAAPLSRNTANAYDALNRLTQITDPNSGNTYFGYDAEDDLTSVKDPRDLTTTYGFNGFGDVTSLVSPDTGTTGSTYDSGGNLSTSTDARGSVAAYSYDAANRVTSIAYTLSGVTDQTITFGYDSGSDGKGRLTSASDANHSLSWSYDFMGRVVGKGLTVGSVNKSVGYGYTNGDRTSLVTPSGQSVVYGFNSKHQVTSVAVNGTTVLSGVTYEPFGAVNGWTWGDGTTVSRTFNGDGLISQIVTAGVTLGYSFDNANRITGISDSSNSALTWAYGYDVLDRLTSATTSVITDGWTYDANGNQLTQTGSTPVTFTVSRTSNQLNATTGSLSRSYSYDAAGHTDSYGSLNFTFNNRGRMESTTASSTDYLYNALGQMYEKSGTLGTTIFMQDEAGHLLGEYSGTGALVEETIWLGDIPIATLQPNGSGGVNIYYIHTDHLNSPRKVQQPTTDILAWRWDTDPYGTTAPNQNPAGLGTFVYNLRFPGQYYMSETGLNQNWNRDYDPLGGGRYIESDLIGLLGGISTYDYARDKPVGTVDFLGLSPADVQAILQFAKSWTSDQTAQGWRIDPGWKNDSCFYLWRLGLVSYCSKSHTYEGCQGQAQTLANALRSAINSGKLKLDDAWTIGMDMRYLPPLHYWVDATSSNSTDPALVLDPWNNQFTQK